MPRLKLFGSVVLEDEGRPVQGAAARRHPLALLALLACSAGQTLNRSKLVGLLWPEIPEDRARTRLNTHLYHVRRRLGGDVVASTGDNLRLDQDMLTCDVWRFQEAMEAGEFERAVGLYEGRFMDGFRLPDTPAFEKWMDHERDRWRRRYRQALEALAERAEERGQPAAAAGWWRQCINEDPYDSRVARRLMEALTAAGNPAKALKVARTHARLLREELGTEPSPEVRELAERIEAGEAEAALTASSPAGGDVSGQEVTADGGQERDRARAESLPPAEAEGPDRRPARREGAESSLLPRGVWLPVAGMVLLAVVGVAVWQFYRSSRARWAREEATPRIRDLLAEQRFADAYALAQEAREHLPDDPVLRDLEESSSLPMTFRSSPSGATVSYKPYLRPDQEWISLGTTPVKEVRVPRGQLRWRARLAGHAPARGSVDPELEDVDAVLVPQEAVPPGMVYVPPGRQRVGASGVGLPGFWIDEHEVTNREFRRFVEDGGYRTPELWGASVPEGESAERFVDRTGQPGPAGWRLGAPPEGGGNLPVTGVSWHEAKAYCSWAEKSLPTLYHWRRAAGQSIRANILLLSNFGASGPAPVGSHDGISRYGAYDMAGNAAEWVANPRNEMRYLGGGAWDEPEYLFHSFVARPPGEREETSGFRCARYPEPPPEAAFSDIERPRYDFADEEPVSDKVYPLLANHYAYESGPLDAAVEDVEENDEWRKETVSFTAGYSDGRVRAHLFLPRDMEPPYQTVVYFPGAAALRVQSSENPAELALVDFLPRTGRALVYPVYDDTYERSEGTYPSGDVELRERTAHWRQDLGRTLDYLETRDDIDSGRIAYFGLSMGATYAPILLAVEERIRVAVLVGAGLGPHHLDRPPEVHPLNFAPRMDTPVLMIAGRNDFLLPVETAQRPLFRRFGTPREFRRLAVLEGGHVPDWDAVIRESVDWLDRHLGPVSGR